MPILPVLSFWGLFMNAILIYIGIMTLNVCLLHTRLNEKVPSLLSFQGIVIFDLYGLFMCVKRAPILMLLCKADQVCQSHALLHTNSLV